MTSSNRIPVILDTDIGTDIDDTWALIHMLRSPELDVRYILSATDDTTYRAKLIARFLEIAGRTDIPVGVGHRQNDTVGGQHPFVADYNLASYPGEVHRDGVGEMIRIVEESPDPITVIAIGPVTNFGVALQRSPDFARNVRFVGMQGSIRMSSAGKQGQIAEYNVRRDIAAMQDVIAAPWKEIILTPLDTCGQVRLEGEEYQQIFQSKDPLLQALIENYRLWRLSVSDKARPYETSSSILFDTVAVHLAFTNKFLKIQPMTLTVDDQGFTHPTDESNGPVQVAIEWLDLPAFQQDLLQRLQSP